MEGYAKVRRHVASEITLLCSDHHTEKTKGLLPIEEVRRADSSPFNKKVGISQPYKLHYEGNVCYLVAGDNEFQATNVSSESRLTAVSIDGLPVFAVTFDQGQLFMTVRALDDADNLILLIEENELVYCIDPWDIEFVGKRLVIRQAPHRFLIDLLFEPPNRITVQRGCFQKGGMQLLISPTEVRTANTRIGTRNSRCVGFDTFIVVGDPPPGASKIGLWIEHEKRHGADLQAADSLLKEAAL
jgi:trigger factor